MWWNSTQGNQNIPTGPNPVLLSLSVIPTDSLNSTKVTEMNWGHSYLSLAVG